MEERIKHLMETLNLSEEEARQMIADDEAIDHGADLFPLTAEQKKASKQARGTGTRAYTFTKRERKADEDKRELITKIFDALEYEADEKPVIANLERQIDFVYNNRNFRIVLSAPRPPKAQAVFRLNIYTALLHNYTQSSERLVCMPILGKRAEFHFLYKLANFPG